MAGFSIKKEYIQPDATTISFYHMTHTRLDGSLAHSVGDEDSNSRASQLAPRIFQDAKSFIWNHLDAGFTSKQIFDEHLQVWQERKRLNQPMQKDDYMTMDNIRNLERRYSKGKWKRHNSESKSVQSWIIANQESVFIIQWSRDAANISHDQQQPFILEIQSPQQQEVMIQFGHNNTISMDSTFGTSRVRFLFYTFLVFDDHRSGFLAAWVITNRETEDCVTKFMEALKRNVRLCSPTFMQLLLWLMTTMQHTMPLGNSPLLKVFLCIQ